MMSDWVKTRILFWFVKAWIINLNFSNALSMLECLILFTKWKLKIRTSEKTSALLTDKNTSFSSNLAIFWCLDAINDESALIKLKIKLRYAIEAEYFLDRSRSRLTDSVRIIESIVRWLFSNSINKSIFDNNNEFSSFAWCQNDDSETIKKKKNTFSKT